MTEFINPRLLELLASPNDGTQLEVAGVRLIEPLR